MEGRVDGPAPPAEPGGALFRGSPWDEDGVAPGGNEGLDGGPDPECDPRQRCSAESGGLYQIGPFHRHAKQVGLELHQPVIRAGPAVHPEPWNGQAGAGEHRVQQLGRAEADRLERRARQMGTRGAAG